MANGCIFVLVLLSFTAAQPEVDTTLGRVRGRPAPEPFGYDANVFRGIPFGKPPIGPLRFAPPLPAEPWQGTRDATLFAPDCYTHNAGMSSSPAGLSEDCLYLNVYNPVDCTSEDRLPVVVWFYGGGFGMGSASFPVYNGAALIGDGAQKVVVVTANYRLGSFGFLASSLLRNLSSTGGMGNQALLDQRLATKWIKDNAKAFCGDPGSITVWGQSAGAASISNHLVMPNSADMFDRAIIDSGPMGTWIANLEDEAEAQFQACAKSVGCGSAHTQDQVACLQNPSLSSEMLSRCNDRPDGYVWYTGFAPTVDGVELPDTPWNMANNGLIHPNKRILLGSNKNEGTILLGFIHINVPKNMTAEQYLEFGQAFFGNGTMGQEMLKLYPVTDFPTPWWGVIQVMTDEAMACPARRTARWAAKAVNTTAYLYEFLHEIDYAKLDPYLGVFHGDELAFNWILRWWYLSWKEYEDVPIGPIPWLPAELRLQDIVSHWWMNFAKTGNPNYAGQPTPTWPEVTSPAPTLLPRMAITTEPQPISDWRPQYCDFWDQYWDWRNSGNGFRPPSK